MKMKIKHGEDIQIENHNVFFEGDLLIANPCLFSDFSDTAKVYNLIISNGYKFLFESGEALFFEKVIDDEN